MTTIYLVRHAEAEGNAYRRAQGQYDSLLTPKGVRQVEALRRRFESEKIDAVFSSDLFRTRATAHPIAADHGLAIAPRRALREIFMSEWEDMPWGSILRNHVAEYEAWDKRPWELNIAGGETFQQVADRVIAVLEEIGREHPSGTVVVASHGGAIRATLCRLYGWPFERLKEVGWCDNTGVAKIQLRDAGATVVYRNDNSHLQGELSTLKRQVWWKEGDRMDDFNMWFRKAQKSDEEALLCWMRAGVARGDAPVGFSPEQAMEDLPARIAQSPDYAALGCTHENVRGLILLSKTDGRGVIDCLTVSDEDWKRGFAEQFLGHAVSVFRAAGKEALYAARPAGERALAFYRDLGFYEDPDHPGYVVKPLLIPACEAEVH